MLRMPMSTSSTFSCVISVGVLDLERHVGDANHLASQRVDNLLIEQIPDDPQHVLVRVIGGQLFVFER